MAEYLLVETLPAIEARGGLFYMSIEGKDFALTPHMFLAIVQQSTIAYRQWSDRQREVRVVGHG